MASGPDGNARYRVERGPVRQGWAKRVVPSRPPGSLWGRDVLILAMNTHTISATEVDADSPASRGDRAVIVSLPTRILGLSLGLLGLGLLLSGLET